MSGDWDPTRAKSKKRSRGRKSFEKDPIGSAHGRRRELHGRGMGAGNRTEMVSRGKVSMPILTPSRKERIFTPNARWVRQLLGTPCRMGRQKVGTLDIVKHPLMGGEDVR